MATQSQTYNNGLKLVLAWGVTQTLINALKLFS